MKPLLSMLSLSVLLLGFLCGSARGQGLPGQAAGSDGRQLGLSVELATYTAVPPTELLIGQPIRVRVRLEDVDSRAAHARWNQLVRSERREAARQGRPFDPSRPTFPKVTPLRLAPGLLDQLTLVIRRVDPQGPDVEVVDGASLGVLLAGHGAIPADGVTIRGRVLTLAVDLPLSWTQGWEEGLHYAEAVIDTRQVEPLEGWSGLVAARSRTLPVRLPTGTSDACRVETARASLLQVQGDLPGARQHLETVAALDDRFEQSQVLLRLSDLCVEMGDEVDGLAYLQRYLDRCPAASPHALEPLLRRRRVLLTALQDDADDDGP